MKINNSVVLQSLTGLFMLFFLVPAQAALLGVQGLPGSPLIETNGTTVTYDYDAISGGDNSGNGGGTLTITGTNVFQSIFTVGSWTYNGGTPVGPSAFIVDSVTGSAFFTTYNLIAYFDDAGLFESGTVEITGVIDASPLAGLQALDQFSGANCIGCGSNTDAANGKNLLLGGDLLDFGFEANAAGGVDALSIDFYMDLTGGDFVTAGYVSTGERVDVGVTASGDVAYGTLSAGAGGNYGMTWDQDAFTDDFVSCTSCPLQVQTFVPVPAAVWLFGSGLLGLIGTGIRNRRKRVVAV